MTLCVAWVRQASDTEELVFATDSTLTGGEKWDHGIKLFELPRKDCLLSFAGSTARAYPLVLNLISSITFDRYLDSPFAHIEEVLKHIAELFTELIQKIVKEISSEDIHNLRSEAHFIFGGWDWRRGLFRVWKLFYAKEVESFLFDEITNDDSKMRFYTLIGDANQDDFIESTKQRFQNLLITEDKMDSKLDMEPLKLLREIALDKNIREVGGSLQIAKVYKSGRTEFLVFLGLPVILHHTFKVANTIRQQSRPCATLTPIPLKLRKWICLTRLISSMKQSTEFILILCVSVIRMEQ